MHCSMPFGDVVRQRRSIRSFTDVPVPDDVLLDALAEAQLTPSNSNTQPWIPHVVGGAALRRLSEALLRAEERGLHTLDFPYDGALYEGEYGVRRSRQGRHLLDTFGVQRDDQEGRQEIVRHNLRFFGAPNAVFLFMPSFGNLRTAVDVGMYAQSLLLSLSARGVGSIAQTTLGFYADTVRETLGIGTGLKLIFGMSIGYADSDWVRRTPRIGRAPVEEVAVLHR